MNRGIRETTFSSQTGAERFGGELLKGRRKAIRPLATNCPIHLVMHSSNELAKGGIFRHRRPVEKIIQAAAKKWNIKIHELAILGSHIHAVVQILSRSDYNHFIQHICGVLAKRFGIRFDLGFSKSLRVCEAKCLGVSRTHPLPTSGAKVLLQVKHAAESSSPN